MTSQRGELRQTDRSRLRRRSDRGRYDVATVDEILAESLVCHVGLDTGEGPVVVPMAFARLNGHLYFHGATGNALLRAMAGGTPACVTVTLLDGLVLSRSAFHHSMNYRCAVLFGVAEPVEDENEKRRAMLELVDHMVPGRSTQTRPPTREELRATLVVRFPIDEGSAKVRTGHPVEEPEDLGLDHWGGVIPLELVRGEPVPDGQ